MPKFEKGKSGNPGGRPKAMREVEALAQKHTAEAITELARIYKNSPSDSARVAAINSILDRAWGKPRQGIDLSGDPDNPIQHVVEVRFVKSPSGAA